MLKTFLVGVGVTGVLFGVSIAGVTVAFAFIRVLATTGM